MVAMPISIAFWVVYLLWVILSFPAPFTWRGTGGSVALFLLVGLLGWHVFGAAVRG